MMRRIQKVLFEHTCRTCKKLGDRILRVYQTSVLYCTGTVEVTACVYMYVCVCAYVCVCMTMYVCLCDVCVCASSTYQTSVLHYRLGLLEVTTYVCMYVCVYVCVYACVHVMIMCVHLSNLCTAL